MGFTQSEINAINGSISSDKIKYNEEVIKNLIARVVKLEIRISKMEVNK